MIATTAYLTSTQMDNGSWNNNAYDTALAIKTLAVLKSNLAIFPNDLAISNKTPLSGDIVNLTANIRNTGTAQAQNIPVQFFAQSATGQLSQVGATQNIPAIQVGASSTITANFDTVGKEGAYSLIVKIDPDNAVEETTKNDNQAYADISITPAKPDLALLVGEMSYSPSAPKTGDIVRITAVVRNSGTAQAANVPVKFYLENSSGASQVGETQLIPTSLVNGLNTVTIDFGATGKEGTYTLIAKVDPDNTIEELSKTNNQASLPLTIALQKPDLSITPTDLTFANPAPWGTLLVIFLLTLFAKMVHFAHATPSPT